VKLAHKIRKLSKHRLKIKHLALVYVDRIIEMGRVWKSRSLIRDKNKKKPVKKYR